jgi:hypothetical protein
MEPDANCEILNVIADVSPNGLSRRVTKD